MTPTPILNLYKPRTATEEGTITEEADKAEAEEETLAARATNLEEDPMDPAQNWK